MSGFLFCFLESQTRFIIHNNHVLLRKANLTLIKLSTTYCMCIFNFFYINRRKYCFRENFRLQVFDGFTRFGIYPEHDLTISGKCLSVCVTKILWQA